MWAKRDWRYYCCRAKSWMLARRHWSRIRIDNRRNKNYPSPTDLVLIPTGPTLAGLILTLPTLKRLTRVVPTLKSPTQVARTPKNLTRMLPTLKRLTRMRYYWRSRCPRWKRLRQS